MFISLAILLHSSHYSTLPGEAESQRSIAPLSFSRCLHRSASLLASLLDSLLDSLFLLVYFQHAEASHPLLRFSCCLSLPGWSGHKQIILAMISILDVFPYTKKWELLVTFCQLTKIIRTFTRIILIPLFMENHRTFTWIYLIPL